MSAIRARTTHDFTVDGYRTLEPLGESRDCLVFRGYSLDQPLHEVVIKVGKSPWEIEGNPRVVQFTESCTIYSQLEHPQIARLLSYGWVDGYPYTVREYFPGVPIDQASLNPLQVAESLRQLAVAIDYAHGENAFHRKIKSTNVLLHAQGANIEVQLIDFDHNAFRLEDELKNDLQSLGALAVQLLAGEVRDGLLSFTARAVPEGLTVILQTLLNQNPNWTYRTARGLAADLQEFLRRVLSQQTGVFELRTKDHSAKFELPTWIGREREAEICQRSLDKSKAEDIQVVALSGPLGIGKTRMLKELNKKWFNSCVLKASGDKDGQGLPHGLMIQLLKDVLSTAFVERLPQSVNQVGAELLDLVPELSPWLADKVERSDILPERKQVRLFSGVVEILRSLATPMYPLVLELDDLHWSDQSTLDFVIFLARQSDSFPVLLLLTYDLEECAANSPFAIFLQRLQGLRDSVVLHLEPLSKDQIGQMVHSVLGKRLQVIERAVCDTAFGNPELAMRALMSLKVSGLLQVGKWGWSSTVDAIPELDLFADLKSLQPSGLLALSVAAAFGQHFTLVQLRAALARLDLEPARLSLRQLESTLAAAVELLWIEPSATGYTFRHSAHRNTLYAQLDHTAEQHCHRALAEVLKDSSAPDAVLGLHYFKAQDFALAAHHYRLAGYQALKTAAYNDAVALFQQALQLSPAELSADRRATTEALADAAQWSGEHQVALRHYEALLADELDSFARAKILGKMANTRLALGEFQTTVEVLNQALRTLGESFPLGRMAGWIFAVRVVVIQAFHSLFLQRKTPSTDARVREIGKLWGQLSYAYYFTDSFRALVTHLRHMNFLESHYLKDQLAQAYANHGPAAAIINWYSRALKYGFKSLALRQELDDRWGTARSRTYLAVTLGSSGAWAAGLEQGLLAESEFAKIGDRSELIILRINIAYQYMLLGQWDKAEYYAHRAAQVAKEFDSITGQIRAAWIRAEMGGRFDSLKLLAEIENLWSLLEPDSEAYAVSMAFNAKGRTLMHLARYQDAEEIFGQGIEHLRSNRLRADYLMALYIGHAEASLATWDLLEQGPNKDLNQVQVANAIRLAQVMTKGYVNYKAGRLRLRAAWAHRQGKFAKAQKLWRKALQVTIDQNYRYQQALVLRDWGHALLGSDKLQAECLFAQALDLLHSLRAKEETQSLAPLVPSHFKKNQSLEAMQVRPAQPLPFSGRLSAGSKREVEAFLRIAEAAKVATNFSEQIACILTEAMKLLAADRAMVQLTSDGGELQTLWTLDSLLGEGVTFSDYNVRAVDQAFASGASVLLNGASSARRSPRSTIAVPLVIQQSVKGVIYMDSAIGSGLFSEDDVQTLTIVANQIAIALETSRAVRNEAEVLHMSKDLELTGVVQRLFLPEMNHCKTAHWELATFHRTATQSGGDWWWYKSEADETLKMIVGDVTGHGAAPAMVTASLASMVRALSESQPVTTLDNVLITVNQNLVEMLRGEYLVAATAIEYKAGHLRLALAASPPVFLLRNSGQVEALTQPGAPLGDVNFLPQFSDYTIQPGDRLLIFTDGVTEMETKRGSFLGDRALLRIFQLQRGEEVEQAVTKIMETLLQRRESTPLRDDMTMVMVEFK